MGAEEKTVLHAERWDTGGKEPETKSILSRLIFIINAGKLWGADIIRQGGGNSKKGISWSKEGLKVSTSLLIHGVLGTQYPGGQHVSGMVIKEGIVKGKRDGKWGRGLWSEEGKGSQIEVRKKVWPQGTFIPQPGAKKKKKSGERSLYREKREHDWWRGGEKNNGG